MTYQQKKALFKAGSYTCFHPYGDTSSWTIRNWVDYIDECGEWLV